MHILLIHQVFVTPDEGGGTRHYELSKYLIQKGHQVTVIANEVDYLTGKKRNSPKKSYQEGMQIIYTRSWGGVQRSLFSRGLNFISFAFFSLFESLKIKNIDIIWATSPPLFQVISAFFISKIKRCPLVFEVRDLWIDFAQELGILKNKHVISGVKFLEKTLYRNSQKIIVNSPGFIPFIEKYVEKDKIELIPNGVITEEFDSARKNTGNFRKQHNLNDDFIAIYLGNIGIANDIESIIAAAKIVQNQGKITFVIMGGGLKKEYFINYLSENKLANVLILDPQPKQQIPYILAEANVCIATLKNIPMFRTTYPNKVFDYMAAGKPTILGIDGVIREIIESAKGGIFFNPGDSKKLAEALLFYYQNSEVRKLHGENARNYVKKHFEREKIADDLGHLLITLKK